MLKRNKNLIVKFLTNHASIKELEELEKWLKKSENKQEFISYVETNYLIDYNLKKFESNSTKEMLFKLIEKEKKALQVIKIRKYMKYAAVFVALIASSYYLNSKIINPLEKSQVVENPNPENNSIQPGTDKATLTLEDGSVIALEKGASFQTKNVKSNGDEIIYKSAVANKKNEIAYNYLTIPRGGEYFVILADGTKVWLNSESQLKYPVSFIQGETREVELVYGEAYFDVSPSTAHKGAKFKVVNLAQEVEVFGTEFNIKAYKDEQNIYTTLVEGKVEVNTNGIKEILKPNYQSNVNRFKNIISVTLVDIKEETSWKNGVFTFKGKPLKDIMKVISRWYDIDVIFVNKDLESVKFKGVLEKNQTIEEILSIMKSNTINQYEIKDKLLIIK